MQKYADIAMLNGGAAEARRSFLSRRGRDGPKRLWKYGIVEMWKYPMLPLPHSSTPPLDFGLRTSRASH